MRDGKAKCLFVNPPIYDFAAYDFWLRPLGLLSVAGMLRGRAELSLYDFLDRRHPLAQGKGLGDDAWGRGKFIEQQVAKPEVFRGI
ncbi:MAG: radical SAM protein, partial [Anaerohalosphaeraceae bacterium]